MKYHLHIYKVVAKAELDVEADNDSDARQQGIDKRKGLKYGESDSDTIVVEFMTEKNYKKLE